LKDRSGRNEKITETIAKYLGNTNEIANGKGGKPQGRRGNGGDDWRKSRETAYME